MNQLVFTSGELAEIDSLLKEIVGKYSSAEDSALLKEACIYAHELPRRVREFLNNFKALEQPPGICVLSGYPVDDAKIGRTPVHWQSKFAISPSLEEETLLVLFGSLLGELLGWATQQDGHIIHDVVPIEGHEHEQLGSGSEQLLWWHTEDAFHPYRCDYLAMLCLRNPDQVETTMANVDSVNLDKKHVEVLFEPRFTIRPDESHLEKNKAKANSRPDGEQEFLKVAYEKVNRMQNSPDKLSVLFGDPRAPYVRIDPYFMDQLHDDEEAQHALDALVENIDEKLTGIVLKPGDFIFIDNYRVVHGRKPFKARYDGFDRWLKRINVTRDLRKSRSARLTGTSQIIF
jgi:Fe(II)/alpha-ketoglutarate-dependent arginine beta-hydroxylase